MNTKVELRRSLLKTRAAITQAEWREKSDRIVTHLQGSALFASAQTILAYFSFRREPDLSLLFTDTKRCWAFPRCVGDALNWHTWRFGDALQVGAYGILEPQTETPTLQVSEVDLILVPSVACDNQGYRLGYGGGYYDRLLNLPEWATIPTIGIVFEFAYLPKLPLNSWDKRLHGICTENYLKMM